MLALFPHSATKAWKVLKFFGFLLLKECEAHFLPQRGDDFFQPVDTKGKIVSLKKQMKFVILPSPPQSSRGSLCSPLALSFRGWPKRKLAHRLIYRPPGEGLASLVDSLLARHAISSFWEERLRDDLKGRLRGRLGIEGFIYFITLRLIAETRALYSEKDKTASTSDGRGVIGAK